MDIYVVQEGDDINSIAEKYGVSVTKLIQDNGLEYPVDLVVGQTIVIAYPQTTYSVQEGDSLSSIASTYGVTLMQLLRNNPFLSNREYIFPGEILTISYNTNRSILTNGFSYTYIKKETLIKTLPYLTYLSIFNYIVTEKGETLQYSDDSEIIKTAKDYSVIPLMLLSTLSTLGEPNIEVAFNILLNEEYQEHHINDIVEIMKKQGYSGVNMVFNYYNKTTQDLYVNLIMKVSNRLKNEGLLFFITINPKIENSDDEIIFDKVDYTSIYPLVDGIIFMQFIWGTNSEAPAPVSSIQNLRAYSDYVIGQIPPDKVILGKPMISYDWQLPYVPGHSSANSLTIQSALDLAGQTGAVIQFDENSQTPFFHYNRINFGAPAEHIVWTIDARSIDVLVKLVIEDGLVGTGVWNIMVFYAQLWLVITSQLDIIKLLPENTSEIIKE